MEEHGLQAYKDMTELFIAVLAYATENNEIFSVDPLIMKDIYETMIEQDSLPELSIVYDDKQQRLKFGVRLVKREQE